MDEPGEHKLIVVSAMSGITDKLIRLAELAKKQDTAYLGLLDELKNQHLQTAQELGISENQIPFQNDFSNLNDLLKAIHFSKNYSEETLELISGYGELWSAQLLHAYLELESQWPKSKWLDAREVLIVRPGETGPLVDWEISQTRFQLWLLENPTPWVVVTGFVASTPEGIATTLKRNGSDFSASIFGALCDASAIVIWTDVDGVMSADPRRVPEAVVLDEMSYDEAIELAYFGAKVVHPHTMTPALSKGIPIWIRNTFNPTHPGTKIHKRESRALSLQTSKSAVKGFSTVDQVTLVNLEGTGMIGVPGVAYRLFGALKEVNVSVILISQASSEHSICFAVPENQGELARKTVEKAFFSEIHHGQIQQVQLVSGCAILAAVGDNMVHSAGISAKFFGALGRASISVRAIAQGSSERNISAVIDAKDSTRALRAVHSGLYLSAQTISVGIIGPGLIGKELISQLEAQASVLKSHFNIDFRIRGILNSSRMVLGNPRILIAESVAELKMQIEKEGIPADLENFASHIQADHLPHAVIVDCTSNDAVASKYAEWLERGIHIVTPNKKANSRDWDYYQKLREISRRRNTLFLYEATVGAGLPIITTLRDLIQTGDEVNQIEGVLSGTLSYLFNSYTGGKSFSDIVMEAKLKGYTEPDPRDDLSGLDVARKLIILAREIGLPLELNQIAVQSLVPKALQSLASADEFLKHLPESDAEMEKLRKDADQAGEVLRYVGVVKRDGQASVELKRFPKTHAFARISGTDNIFAFHTRRYSTQPLIIQGPGAGPEVTAGGIFSDLLRLASFLSGA